MDDAVRAGGAVGAPETVRSVATPVATFPGCQDAPYAARFWSKVDRSAGPDACWPWLGVVAGKGYGYFSIGPKHVRAHRVAYELTRGPIPAGKVLDHRVCDNRLCCNPAHLKPCTNRQNVLRGNSPNAIAWRTDTCKRGHSLENARVTKKGRDCRACHNLREQARRARRHLAATEVQS